MLKSFNWEKLKFIENPENGEIDFDLHQLLGEKAYLLKSILKWQYSNHSIENEKKNNFWQQTSAWEIV